MICAGIATLTVIALMGPNAIPAAPSAPDGDVIVSPAWLSQHLKDRDLVILQLTAGRQAAKQHLPGARVVAVDFFESSTMGMGAAMDMSRLPDASELQGKLEKLGISDDTHVVVVLDGEEIPSGTRALFLVTYGGVRHTSFLDGGLAAWTRAGLPLTTAPAAIVPGHFTRPLDAAIVADFSYVQAHIKSPHVRVIDARAPVYFDGAPQEKMGMAAGHIPGAANIPFNTLTDDMRRVLPLPALEEKFRAAGVQPGDTVIAYCHVGIQGTVVVLGARALGHPVRLYPGSFHDWSARKLPTEGGTR